MTKMEASSDLFRDRVDAGRRLAKELSKRNLPGGETVVLGIPRGGFVVAAEVAEKLGEGITKKSNEERRTNHGRKGIQTT
jgi:adenine/guanine phosphoribosyltransferase-like PRPP-binding protein